MCKIQIYYKDVNKKNELLKGFSNRELKHSKISYVEEKYYYDSYIVVATRWYHTVERGKKFDIVLIDKELLNKDDENNMINSIMTSKITKIPIVCF